MIQDIAPSQLHIGFENRAPLDSDAVLLFQNRAVCVRSAGAAAYPSYAELREHCAAQGAPIPELRYLFSIDERGYYLSDAEELPLSGFAYRKLFDLIAAEKGAAVLAAATGFHLAEWYRTNRFCGACGNLMAHSQKERALFCAACSNIVYPRISPGVIVGVHSGEKLLLTKYKGREYTRYALIAGFVEVGEDAEETVRREVLEEVGLRVKNLRYYKSQPWGRDGGLLMGFFAQAEEPQAEIVLDEDELSVAEWVEGAEIKYEEAPISLTGEMMQAFRAGVIAAREEE